MESLRRAIQDQVHGLVGFGSGELDLDRPPGDEGLFGPQSACWRVHGDFTSMMIGGTSALLLQMLHPLALAGVWDHSDFERDRAGRLRRTAQFVAGTTYGAKAEAERLIDRVRTIHDRVAGVLPDGTPYSANDPELLTWVHVAEASSFLAAYLRYRDSAFPAAEQDRYYDETALVAERLGAREVPRSRRAVETYLQAVRPQLRADERTRAVAAALLDQPSPHPLLLPVGKLLAGAAIDLLPAWARALHRYRMPEMGRSPLRLGVHGVGRVLRWALTDGSAKRAQARLA
ncbi:oxygenase MpaB family protein [Sphingomonas sp. BIUV-7]|uniref:Oxygenase MpaB family protein n=1 Tax=Sphingomonas natans TaxID=3063330 RepID=A0ABT8Y921_9SPHN|nr:oxygenase MpaB family protein [Sphingomonas sp. BIUV-7]MDO6414828.1 oxygenase MpaB family protein [Sphingomonas sp. BIUV-7]